MSQQILSREDLLSDAVIVTSESPAVTRKALVASGAKDKDSAMDDPSDDDEGADRSEPGTSDDDTQAESGDDSDSSKDEGTGDDDAGSDDDSSDQAEPDADSDDDDKDDDTVDAQGVDSTKTKKANGIDKRFKSFTRKLGKKDQEIAELRGRVEELSRASKPAETKPDTTKLDTATDKVEEFSVKPAPKQDDVDAKGNAKYPSYGDYVEAMGAWSAEVAKDANTHSEKRAAKLVETAIGKLKAEFEAKERDLAVQSEVNKITSLYEERKAKLMESNPEFEKYVVKNENRPELAQSVSSLIILHSRGPEVLLQICKNPKLAKQLNAMSPDDQKVQFGVIIASLKSPSSKPRTTDTGNGTSTRRQVRPNEPIPRGSQAGGKGSKGALTYKNAEDMDGDAYIEARRSGKIH